MIIKTKFDIGQEVFYIHPIKKIVEQGFVSRIIAEYYDNQFVNFEKDIGYQLGTMIPIFSEEQLFATKEEAEVKLKELIKE